MSVTNASAQQYVENNVIKLYLQFNYNIPFG